MHNLSLSGLEDGRYSHPFGPIPVSMAGVTLFLQAAYIDPGAPCGMVSLTEIVDHGLQLLPEQPNASFSVENKSALDTIQKTSRYILENLDMIYAADKKPQHISDENWRSAKTKMQHFAQTVMNRAATLATHN